MTGNLIQNGDFETGDFTNWTVQDFDITEKPRVEQYEGSYQARMVGGRADGQLLYTRFKAGPGSFKLSFNCGAPNSVEYKDLPDPLVNAFIVYFVSGFASGSSEIINFQWSYSGVNPKSSLITFTGEMESGVEEIEVRLSIPSDPFGNKGPYYFDKMVFEQTTAT